MRFWRVGVAAAVWALLIWWLSRQSPSEWVGFLQGPWGPPAYLLAYAVRPLAFFPSGVMSALSGSLWGPVLGVIVVVLGSNISALVGYGVGLLLGTRIISPRLAERYGEPLRRDPFGSVMFMRAVMVVPFDLASVLSAVLRLPLRSFVAGTALGSLPGTLMFTLAGAALPVEEVLAGRFRISFVTMAAAGLMLLVSLWLSRRLRRTGA